MVRTKISTGIVFQFGLEKHLIDVKLGLPDAVPCGPRAVSRRGMTCLGKVAPHLHHGSTAANEKVSGVGK